MCPLWPFHIIIMYILMLGPLWLVAWGATIQAVKNLPFKFSPSSIEVQMGQTKEIHVFLENNNLDNYKWLAEVEKEREYVADVKKTYLVNMGDNMNWTSVFSVKGNFLGVANVKLRTYDANNKTVIAESSDSLTVSVVRGKRIVDKVFNYSLIVVISLLYINFGSALDWELLKDILRKPIGPTIGFVCQFLFMPLFAFGLGKWLFPDMPELQLGLFFMGISPGGGASNIWCVALDGNLDLSIAMTTISSFAAFGMIPFWLFALGNNVLKEAKLVTPYGHISHYVLCLVIPIAIGLAIQKFLPKVSKILVRLLKPISIALIVFIVVFASVTDAYLYKLFTWPILAAAVCLPWLGYLCGYLAAWVLGQPFENIMAIAIETGVQNAGIPIFMIRLSLPQPAADITTAVPVVVSMMTPIPLTILYIALKLRARWNKKKKNIFHIKEDATTNDHVIL